MDVNYRGRHDIISEILEICADGYHSKTHIMFDAHISYGQLKQYLALLQQKTFLNMNSEGKFKTTDRGNKFLNVFREIQTLMG